MHDRIRRDERVVVMERTNVRHLQPLPEPVDLITLDLSFISVLLVLPAVLQSLKPGGKLIILIKPQFEAARGEVGRGGVVRSPEVHNNVVQRVILGASQLGLACIATRESPLKGAKEGNTEFLALFLKGGDGAAADGESAAPTPTAP